MKTAVATASRTSYDKGLEAGREEVKTAARTSYDKGLDKGREEGREGQYALVERVLLRKFGALSENVQHRLRALSAERLGDVLDGALAGSSLRDLGLAD